MKILFLFCLLITVTVNSQDSLFLHLPLEDGRVVYTRIFDIDSTPKERIIANIKDWSVNSYGSQKAALQVEDKDLGYIAFKGYLPITLLIHGGMFNGNPYQVKLFHTLKFYIKDNKLKMVFSDLEILSELATDILGTTTPTPVERMDAGLDKVKTKKRERLMDGVQRDARRINRLTTEFLTSVQKKLTSGKSAFDF
jgi:hypothetical protein